MVYRSKTGLLFEAMQATSDEEISEETDEEGVYKTEQMLILCHK